MDIFCKIINKETPAEVVYEDENIIAFLDLHPVRPGHFLVVPKTHSTNLIDISDEEFSRLMLCAKKLAKEQIKKLGVTGFTIIVNNGIESRQVVFHTHVHVIPSLK